jgi:polygalacturonase
MSRKHDWLVVAGVAALVGEGSLGCGRVKSMGPMDEGMGGAGGATVETGAGGSMPMNGAGGAVLGNGGAPGSSGGVCGANDSNLPAEPTLPATVCATLMASFAIVDGTPPDETNLDTTRLQMALSACPAGQAVKLVTDGASNGFIIGPITVPANVTLWVDAGVTLFGTRDPNVYGPSPALIQVRGANVAIVGDGVIDGQGGETMIGGTMSFWDQNGMNGSSPALIQVASATNFTLYRITLHNSPMFHVKLSAKGFVAWGVTIKTPSAAMNSAGKKLTPSGAHNTDGIDPGESASNGFIVCSSISVGDDHIAIKGGTGVDHLIIAHNHFGAGHGMSIGSETNGGVSNVSVYDLTIDGMGTGQSGGSSNGIRIKSDPSRGGKVTNVDYNDICVRNLTNPIILTPLYSMTTGTLIPWYTGITIRNFHSVASTVNPKVTLLGYDAMHMLGVGFDNVVIEGLTAGNINASNANIALGPGDVSFTPTGTNVLVSNGVVAGSSTPNPCDNRWVTF